MIACVRVPAGCAAHVPCRLPPVRVRVQSNSADPMSFTGTSSQGAAVSVEGRVVWHVSYTPRGAWPWALVGATIESMITAAGDAWSEFVHVRGSGAVAVFVAPEGMDGTASAYLTTGNGAVACGMVHGRVFVSGAVARNSTPNWPGESLMAPGESVRIRYVAATRMVSVVYRGRSYDLAALPATADIAHMRFGVALGGTNSMRVVGASIGGACRTRARAFAIASRCGSRCELRACL